MYLVHVFQLRSQQDSIIAHMLFHVWLVFTSNNWESCKHYIILLLKSVVNNVTYSLEFGWPLSWNTDCSQCLFCVSVPAKFDELHVVVMQGRAAYAWVSSVLCHFECGIGWMETFLKCALSDCCALPYSCVIRCISHIHVSTYFLISHWRHTSKKPPAGQDK